MLKRGKRKQNSHPNDVPKNRLFKATQDESEEETGTDDEERDLESFLFGDISKDIVDNSTMGKIQMTDDADADADEDTEDTDLLSFQISTKPSIDFHIEGGEDEFIAPIQLGSKSKNKPMWEDPDDKEISVDILAKKNLRKLREEDDEKEVLGTTFQERLKTNYEKVLPAPAWAGINTGKNVDSEDEDNEEEDEIFKTRKQLISKHDHLLKGVIDIKKLKPLNTVEESSSVITSLKFHPSAKIAMTTSLNKNLCLYQVDGRENKKLQSIHLERFPIYCADFTAHGDKVICSSRRKHYYVYDLVGGSVVKIPGIKGRNEKSLEKFTLSPDGEIIAFLGESGYINLVSTKNNQWISSLKMNGKVNCVAFSPDSSKLYSAGRDGEVYIWDVKSRRCQHRFVDSGSLRTTSIAIPQNQQYIALGSSSGVVNVYDDKCHVEKTPTPLKAIMNLTTAIGGTTFNPTSETLACYSSQVRNAIKLVHLPSLTTFSNWPMEKQTLGNISCLDFSPKSGYLAVGNEKGKALLFRLNHFPDS